MKKLEVMQILGAVVRDLIAKEAGYRRLGRLQHSFRFLANSRSVRIWSIYYWTRFVNDGHPAVSFSKESRRQMIFYKDPADDPRISSDYPKSRATRRKLTSAELERDRDLLIVTRKVRATEPTRFIEAGIREARSLVPKKVREKIQGDVRRLIRRKRDKITVAL